MSFWNACTHSQTTEADEMGDALCVSCGAKVRTTLTRAGLLDAFDTVYRNFGLAGRHSKRCVILEDRSWVCAEDCRMARC
jgi:hypothetical protein